MNDILALIDASDASPRAKENATKIFCRLGECEAAVHGVPVEEIHFHEVGAVDSIVDIFGICIALELLGVERVYRSGFKCGHGVVKCAHGTMPVPAPATVKLLAGQPVEHLDISCELTTPTGAAVLTALAEEDWTGVSLRMLGVGCGHGRREFSQRPNMIRAHLAEIGAASAGADKVEVIETDVDDQSAEASAQLAELLLRAGALDVSMLSVQMKKGRPGVRLTVVCHPGEAEDLACILLGQGTTIGVRIHTARRMVLPRSAVTVSTPWGDVCCKRVERPSGIEIVPEFESCRQIAESADVPLRRVMDAARSWEN